MHDSQRITFPTQLCLVLGSFCTNLLHSFIMWLIVLFLSPLNQHLLFCCCVYFCFHIVLIVLFCAAIRRDSVSILRFFFLSHDQVFLCDILLVCRLKCPCSCFSYHFCFMAILALLMLVLSILFLITVINLLLQFLMKSSSLCIDAIFNVCKSPSSFYSWLTQSVYIIPGI